MIFFSLKTIQSEGEYECRIEPVSVNPEWLGRSTASYYLVTPRFFSYKSVSEVSIVKALNQTVS